MTSSDRSIIMLTAKAKEIEKIAGLELGADDYVTTYFSPRELVARSRATLRRDVPLDAAHSRVKVRRSILPSGRFDKWWTFTTRTFDLTYALRYLVLTLSPTPMNGTAPAPVTWGSMPFHFSIALRLASTLLSSIRSVEILARCSLSDSASAFAAVIF